MNKVDIHYLEEPCSNYIHKSVETILRVHLQEGPGDILTFLTGKEDIDAVYNLLTERLEEYVPLIQLISSS
jgi:ATP-dependent RNA helicase DDX35